MNCDYPEGNRGGNITPSARKPIHGCGEPYQKANSMVRYGDDGDSSASDHEQDQGIDEVDNIMSKMSRETSPLPIRKKKRYHTNSNSQDGEYSDDNIDKSNVEDRSYLSISQRSQRSFTDERPNFQMNRSNSMSVERRQEFSKRRGVSVVSGEDSNSQNTSRIFIIFITLVAVIVAALYTKLPNFVALNDSKEKYTQTEHHDSIIFENNMNNLQEKYNIDDNSILKLKTGLSTIFSRMDAGSFMFVYDTNTNNFNPIRFDKFIDEVSFTAARYLRNHIAAPKHTVVVSSNLDMREHGELIAKYRDEVYKSGVLLVKEVEGVPSDLAMAFHYYCDEYEPLVKRSAIFFTLNIANCSSIPDPESTHNFIEKCLARKWTTVPKENMRPLLTRVVDVIIDVTSVF
ncbi:uncharacterized protein LOC113492532 isoform X2 [Trichoplusia ni]|uniref:Uncharacterized protein LOC113492532 isoform X2 n=1 Tax=Trichoplusia ni TaxID=7111 RepID=A0A7E5VBZ5_TRINI|nr:uncharacterized protein LOC113492532 isoform X2 [Trichoplusia ni]